jgi:hypothetical protein
MLEIIAESQFSRGEQLKKRVEIAIGEIVDLEVSVVMVVTENRIPSDTPYI